MRRLIVFIALITFASLGLAWLAERPGDIVLNAFGYRVETTLFVAAIAFSLFVFAAIIVVQIVRAILHGPEAFRMYLSLRRQNKGLQAIARGLVAVGAWDVRQAQRASKAAQTFLGDTPLTLLLRSQTAQLTGDKVKARTSFEAMLLNPETRLLGLRGLYVEAQREGDATRAATYAEAASKMKADLPWASTALLITQAREDKWDDVLATLKTRQRHRLITKDEARKLRAVALTAQAKSLIDINREQARKLSVEAYLLDATLAPAVVQAAQLYSEIEDFKTASKMLEKSWKASPHPSVAHLYTNLLKGDSAKDRLKRARQLLRLQPNHPEGLIAMATAAAEARDFPLARDALKNLIVQNPTQRICLLMAKLAEAENDIGAMRGWLDRAMRAPRDAIWMADGQVLSAWAPISPVSGDLGAVHWQVPHDQPQGLVLLQEQMPKIPDLIHGPPFSSLPRPKQDVSRPSTPQPAVSSSPFVPDDPGLNEAETEDSDLAN
ncbi:MAG: heme biosynthesis HemY N-terminal domain-containing protein [Pseudomonadota bacterium]